MSYYVLSKSKTGKIPRTGIRYSGAYLKGPGPGNQRIFVLTGVRMNGKVDTKTYESVTAAKKAGWVKVA